MPHRRLAALAVRLAAGAASELCQGVCLGAATRRRGRALLIERRHPAGRGKQGLGLHQQEVALVVQRVAAAACHSCVPSRWVGRVQACSPRQPPPRTRCLRCRGAAWAGPPQSHRRPANRVCAAWKAAAGGSAWAPVECKEGREADMGDERCRRRSGAACVLGAARQIHRRFRTARATASDSKQCSTAGAP